jgi:hypothetical protein
MNKFQICFLITSTVFTITEACAAQPRFTQDVGATTTKALVINLMEKDLQDRVTAYDEQVQTFGMGDDVVGKVNSYMKRYKDKTENCLKTGNQGADCSLEKIWKLHITTQKAGRDDVGGNYNKIEAELTGDELAEFKKKRAALRAHQTQWGKFCKSLFPVMGAAIKCEKAGYKGAGCTHKELMPKITAAFNAADSISPIPKIQKDLLGSEYDEGDISNEELDSLAEFDDTGDESDR